MVVVVSPLCKKSRQNLDFGHCQGQQKSELDESVARLPVHVQLQISDFQ